MPTTARGTLPFPLGGDTPDVPRDILALANRLAAIAVVFVQDLSVNRPAANAMGGAGFLFYATNSGILSYSDGAAWHDINSTTSTAFTDAPGTTIFQEGVINPGEGVVTRLSNAGVRVAAGSAWIDGDGVVGAGRYPCNWVQTDLTGIPATAAGTSRVDRIVVQLNGQYGVAPTIRRLPGGQAAGESLDTRPNALAIPAGHLHLADVLVDNTGVVATAGIRSRRTFSGGWNQTIRREANGGGTNDYFSTAGLWTPVGGLLFPVDIDIKPGNAITATLEALMQAGGTVLIQFQVYDYDTATNALSGEVHVDGLAPDGAGYFSMKSFQLTNVAAPAAVFGETSIREEIQLLWAPGAGGGRIIARNQMPVTLTLKEHRAGPPFAETHDH